MIKSKRLSAKVLYMALLPCLIVLPGSGCTTSSQTSHILCRQEGLSRERIYIDFSKNSTPYETQAIVGGEHMTFYKVLGFEGDEFLVTVQTLEGNVAWGVTGDQTEIKPVRRDNMEQKRITVADYEAFFTIDFSAHPYGEYKLRVEKLPICDGGS